MPLGEGLLTQIEGANKLTYQARPYASAVTMDWLGLVSGNTTTKAGVIGTNGLGGSVGTQSLDTNRTPASYASAGVMRRTNK